MNFQHSEIISDIAAKPCGLIKSAGVVSLLFVVALSGCTSFQETYGRKPPVVTAPAPQPGIEQPSDRAPATADKPEVRQSEEPRRSRPSVQVARAEPLPAANHFIQQARTASDQGDYAQALSLLERARRISPGAGEVYLEIAEVHMNMGDTAQAKQFCYKAQSLSGDDAEFKERIRRVLNQIGSA
ncbi:tetratricopeptide repeat protein [Allohahella sp. A8]|uniref:tetratricopeptide repeat protein n=1 Tax=Allohahella sp. A8 TaxID=3141461 RepID=UPI000C08EE87|nr:hypothetical protein [Hahellaceae bacterium]|tara:strand:+ start:15618 stop:16172 length:555 start_codon:yes stop_codon:yes gene_type:complete